MFEIKKIHKKYKEKVILEDFSLSMKEGEVVVLLGRSGEGKSTLLRILNGLESFESGQVFLKGVPLKEMEVGMVFQEFHLFTHLTAEKNLALPLELKMKKTKQEAKQMAKDLLDQFNLQNFSGQFPSKLSGGQKQRLAIARAISMSPSVLCMDEPTSALDPKTTQEVLDTIKILSSKGYFILITTHDLSFLEKIECTLCLMEKGKIQEKVSSREFFTDQNRYPLILSHFSR